MSTPSLFILALFLLCRLTAVWLALLNRRHLAAYGHRVPPGFEEEVDQAHLARMRDYTLASGRLHLLMASMDTVVLLLFFWGGGLDWYHSSLAARNWSPLLSGVVFFLLLLYGSSLLHLPFQLYHTFGLEQRFGFNTRTVRLWCRDLIKELLLTTLLAGLLLTGSLWLLLALPNWWWLAVWLLFLLFNLTLLYLSPLVIEPLFNTYTPITDEALAGQIREVLAKAGIVTRQILTMDASRRSTHSNAYFSGIGRSKRIILFDTLLASHRPEEIIAVLAHEAGHWRRGHLNKRLLLSQGFTLAGLYLLFRLMELELLIDWFGLQTATLHAQLLLGGLLLSLLAFPLRPLTSFWSRRQEREADDEAVRLTGSPRALARALIRLARENLANLHPHPWYASFYYSHPPLPQRVTRLLALAR